MSDHDGTALFYLALKSYRLMHPIIRLLLRQRHGDKTLASSSDMDIDKTFDVHSDFPRNAELNEELEIEERDSVGQR